MISKEMIDEIKNRLIHAANPKKIILFGSYASGVPTDDSDLDILIIEQFIDNKFQEMIRLRKVLRGLKIPVDIIVATIEEFQARSSVPGTVYYWAKRDGKIIYEEAA